MAFASFMVAGFISGNQWLVDNTVSHSQTVFLDSLDDEKIWSAKDRVTWEHATTRAQKDAIEVGQKSCESNSLGLQDIRENFGWDWSDTDASTVIVGDTIERLARQTLCKE